MKKRRWMTLVCTLMITACSHKNEELNVFYEWDLMAVAYSDTWCSELKDNSDFKLGIIDFNSEAVSDDKKTIVNHSELVMDIVQKLAPECKTEVVIVDSDVTEEQISEAIMTLYSYGCHVINMSVGTSHEMVLSEQVMEKILNDSLVLVCAAGNQKNGVLYPAALEETISVFARDINGGIAKADIDEDIKRSFSAPGYHVYACGNYYSGSSLATVYVSVAFAALYAKYPQKDAKELIEIAKESSGGSASVNDLGMIQLKELLCE